MDSPPIRSQNAPKVTPKWGEFFEKFCTLSRVIQNIIAKMNPGPKNQPNMFEKLPPFSARTELQTNTSDQNHVALELSQHAVDPPCQNTATTLTHQPVQAPRDQPVQLQGGAAVARRMASSIIPWTKVTRTLKYTPFAPFLPPESLQEVAG